MYVFVVFYFIDPQQLIFVLISIICLFTLYVTMAYTCMNRNVLNYYAFIDL